MKQKYPSATAQYEYGLQGKVVWIEDIGKECRSVTNDLENVLNDIIHDTKCTIADYKVVYLDSMGNWDGVKPHVDANGRVVDVGFYPLNTRDKQTAIKNAR